MYSSYESEKTFVKQADSAQNKHTANEVESFKLKMFQTKDGLFFYQTRFFHELTLTPDVGDKPNSLRRTLQRFRSGSSVKPSPSIGRFNRSD